MERAIRFVIEHWGDRVVPDWIRLALVVLSILSFFPQLARICARQETTGISLFYVLFNLVSATEEFAIIFFLVVTHGNDMEYNFGVPRGLPEWLNLAQVSGMCLMLLIQFTLCLYYESSRLKKTIISTLYIGFLLISVAPVVNEATAQDNSFNGMGADMLLGISVTLVSPIAVMMGTSSFLFQWRKPGALSITGLAAQALVFSLVAISWLGRIDLGDDPINPSDSNELYRWCNVVGRAVTVNAAFASVQLLLCVAYFSSGRPETGAGSPDEEKPLFGKLGSRDDETLRLVGGPDDKGYKVNSL